MWSLYDDLFLILLKKAGCSHLLLIFENYLRFSIGYLFGTSFFFYCWYYLLNLLFILSFSFILLASSFCMHFFDWILGFNNHCFVGCCICLLLSLDTFNPLYILGNLQFDLMSTHAVATNFRIDFYIEIT